MVDPFLLHLHPAEALVFQGAMGYWQKQYSKWIFPTKIDK